MKIYLSAKRALLFTLCSAFTYVFIFLAKLSWSLYLASLVVCALLLSTYVACNIRIVLQRRYRLVNALSLLYAGSALASYLLTDKLAPNVMLLLLLNTTVLPFVEIQREKGHVQFLFKVMIFWLALLLIANDILMVIMPGQFYGDGLSRMFLLGGKFSVAYNHMALLMLICLLYEQRLPSSRALLPLFAVVCLLCEYMDCNTAALGTIVFYLVVCAPRSVQSTLSRKSIVLLAITLSALFVYSESVFQLPPVKYFITEVLERDLTLTGRAQIYEVLGKIIRAHPWIGYGGSAEIILKYTGAYNVQNGFFDLVVQNGFPSALLYVALMISLIKPVSSRNRSYLLGIIYAYLFMATVEITFDITLLMFGILLFIDIDNYAENPVKIIEWGCETIDSRTPVCQ